MKLSKRWTTVSPLSKTLALALFILLPFIGFYLGVEYQKLDSEQRRLENARSIIQLHSPNK